MNGKKKAIIGCEINRNHSHAMNAFERTGFILLM